MRTMLKKDVMEKKNETGIINAVVKKTLKTEYKCFQKSRNNASQRWQ